MRRELRQSYVDEGKFLFSLFRLHNNITVLSDQSGLSHLLMEERKMRKNILNKLCFLSQRLMVVKDVAIVCEITIFFRYNADFEREKLLNMKLR